MDLVNYAGVSGDLNPIHWDDEIAKQVGLDTAIAHGMLTMGLGGGYVTSWVGDPAAVTEYNVRFTAVVPVPNDGVGAEIVFNGRVKSVEPEDEVGRRSRCRPPPAGRRSSAAPSRPRSWRRRWPLKTDILGMVYQLSRQLRGRPRAGPPVRAGDQGRRPGARSTRTPPPNWATTTLIAPLTFAVDPRAADPAGLLPQGRRRPGAPCRSSRSTRSSCSTSRSRSATS